MTTSPKTKTFYICTYVSTYITVLKFIIKTLDKEKTIQIHRIYKVFRNSSLWRLKSFFPNLQVIFHTQNHSIDGIFLYLMVKLQYALFIGLKSLEILRVQVLYKSAARHFSTKLIKVQVLNKSMQVGIFQKINKICCTIIRETRVAGEVNLIKKGQLGTDTIHRYEIRNPMSLAPESNKKQS